MNEDWSEFTPYPTSKFAFLYELAKNEVLTNFVTAAMKLMFDGKP